MTISQSASGEVSLKIKGKRFQNANCNVAEHRGLSQSTVGAVSVNGNRRKDVFYDVRCGGVIAIDVGVVSLKRKMEKVTKRDLRFAKYNSGSFNEER